MLTNVDALFFQSLIVTIPCRPFYLDRITYELDLMAPVGKPLRKMIDVNCSSGEWALVCDPFVNFHDACRSVFTRPLLSFFLLSFELIIDPLPPQKNLRRNNRTWP